MKRTLLARIIGVGLLVGASWALSGCGDDDDDDDTTVDASVTAIDAAGTPDAGAPDAAASDAMNACVDPSASLRTSRREPRAPLVAAPLAIDAGPGASDGGIVFPDAGVTPDAGSGASCNPVSQTGCNAGEKCAYIVDQLDPWIAHVGCTPDGTQAIGDACTEAAAVGTSDDCAAGGDCYNGYCHETCATVNDQCSDGFCQTFVDSVGNPLEIEICLVSCNPLLQDCPAENEGCYVAGAAVCVVGGTATEGQPCMYANSCEAGLMCVGSVCRPFCGPMDACWEKDGDGVYTTPSECGCGACAACGPSEVCFPITDGGGGLVSDFFGFCAPDTDVGCDCGSDPICSF